MSTSSGETFDADIPRKITEIHSVWEHLHRVSNKVAFLRGHIDYLSISIVHRRHLIDNLSEDDFVELLKQSAWISQEPITLEDFIEFPSIRNNFRLYFDPTYDSSFIGAVYRQSPLKIKFDQQKPQLSARIENMYGKLSLGQIEGKNLLKKLYEAYLIMRTYPEVTSNHILFR